MTLNSNVAQIIEGSLATSAASTVFSGVGGDNVSGNALTALQNFEAAVGGVKNTAAKPQADGFRVITWDGVKTDGTEAGTIVINGTNVGIPINRFQTQGSLFETVYAVSGDGFKSTNASVNAASPDLFPAFSPNNTFAMFNDNGIEFSFVLPSTTATTPLPAASRGFGAIFRNVTVANTTGIEYFSGSTLLGTFFVPVGTQGQAEFLGVLFPNAVVTNIAIFLGTDVLFDFNGSGPTGGGVDNPASDHNLVATDDFVFAEPVANAEPPITGSGVLVAGFEEIPLTNVAVARFTHLDGDEPASGFSAVINWGDGTPPTPGLVTLSSGTYTVTGSHTYQDEGHFTIHTTVTDDSATTTIATSAVILDVLPDGTRGTLKQRLTAEIFEDLVGQPIDAANLKKLTRLLGSGRPAAIRLFFDNPRFNRKIATNLVNALFQDLLNRPPSSQELKSALHFLRNGGRARQLFKRTLGGSQSAADQALAQGLVDYFLEDPVSSARFNSILHLIKHNAPNDVLIGFVLGLPEYRAKVV